MKRKNKKHQRSLRLLTLAVGLLTVFGGLGAWRLVSAADRIPSQIEIAGVAFNPADGDRNETNWSYHKDSNTLTLNNFTSNSDILGHNGDLRIKLVGDNVITNKGVHAGDKVIITADSTGKLLIDVDGFSRALIGTGKGYIQNGGTVELKQELNGQPVTNSASLLWMEDGGLEVNNDANLIVAGQSDGAHSLCGTHALTTVDYKFNTSGKVQFHMRSTKPNDPDVIAVCGWASNPQAKKAIMLGTGQYSFEAPLTAFTVPVKLENNKEIEEPIGATIDPDGNIIGTTNFNKIVFKKTLIQSVVTITDGTSDKVSPVTEGEVVRITANAAPAGQEFDRWVVKSGGVVLADAMNKTTTFTMGNQPVDIEATFKPKMITTAINCGANGNCVLTPAGASHAYGTDLKLKLTANADYVIDKVKRSGVVVDEYSNKDLTSVEIDFKAIFNTVIDVEFKAKPVILPPAPEVTTDKPTLAQQEQLTVEVKNLTSAHQGKTLDIFINSIKTKLASLTVSGSVMTTTVSIPCSIEAGNHTITAEVDGVQVGSGIALTVTQNAACQTTAQPAKPNQTIKTPNSGYQSTNSISLIVVAIVAVGLVAAVGYSFKR